MIHVVRADILGNRDNTKHALSLDEFKICLYPTNFICI